MDEFESQYDAFGNYIGGADESGSDAAGEGTYDGPSYVYDQDSEEEQEVHDEQALMQIDETPSNAVILHEDKQYYQTAAQLYGEDVELLVEEADAQALSVPIIAPIEPTKFQVYEANLPETYYSHEFLSDLSSFPHNIRNIALVGDLHHGKTALIDFLIHQTHNISEQLEKRTGKRRDEQLRYTDTHFLERERGLSIKSAPITILMQDMRAKSYVLNIIDTPGKVDFIDETIASMKLVDGVIILVDAVEGVQITTEKLIQYAVREELKMTLVINKFDRLILELKLPPTDAYFKLKHTIESVNNIIENMLGAKGESQRLSPEKGNVAFACADMEWVFTIPSFAKQYSQQFSKLDPSEFAKRLWGDIFYNPKMRKFSRKAAEEGAKRSFVHWVLEPIYKLYSCTLSESPDDLSETLSELGIALKPAQLRSDAKVLLKLVCAEFFGGASPLIQMVVDHIPSPIDGAARQIAKNYTGPQADASMTTSMAKCDADGPLVVQVTKLYSNSDATDFDAFGRVMSGTARVGDEVRVLGETYSIDDPEDMTRATITEVKLTCSRYSIPVSGSPAGTLVLLSGVSKSISKTATIVANTLPDDEDVYIFRPIRHVTEAVIKVALEPMSPSELPKLLAGLRSISKSYPLSSTSIAESGEISLLGTGELYCDCMLYDLRHLFANIDIRISDPSTIFAETVAEQSAIISYALSQNKANKISILAEPLDEGVAQAIERGSISLSRSSNREVGKYFQENFDWDVLESRGIWAFGPNDDSPNVLIEDVLPTETNKKLLKAVKESIKQGFNWATREGVLCEQPMRNVKFRITKVELAEDALKRGAGQLIPMARRAVHSAFLTAQPRLMEPVYAVRVLMPADSVPALYTVLTKRRGHVLEDGPLVGTPLYSAKAIIPVQDSFGFETDLKVHTRGMASVSMAFENYSVVSGDPLDKTIQLRPLETAGPQQLARDYMIKTRRRKGVVGDVNPQRLLEPELWKALQETGMMD